ncbi:MAG: HRDC domain-containing protein [Muribaculaceae bacterium]|nr:HRDC domain-containing protein [Muribaculaceae bacterium]
MAKSSNPELELARHLIERTGVNLFLTGKAGTGKTTFLRDLRQSSQKRIVVLAPTGIAAINAGGMTIHSFFQLDFAPFFPGAKLSAEKRRYDRFNKAKRRVIGSMDLLVIDEISMVRADLLDAVDDVLRRHRDPTRPFGGVQLLLIGDLQQLPPVVKEDEWEMLGQYYRSPYFFDSNALAQTQYVTVELKKVYRQNEGRFLDLLNHIRSNTATPEVIAELNTRFRPDFTPPPGERYIRLTTHNFRADAINRECMSRLKSSPMTFKAEVEGIFPDTSFPAPETLVLKRGAQVMFVKNDPTGEKAYYNGMLGEVTALDEDTVTVRGADTGLDITVGAVDWDNVKYEIDPATRQISEEICGTFRQIPLRPAWAITIHKSQGLTFDRAIIDAADAFAHGQAYVALSRCRTLEGLVLDAPLRHSSLICDPTVGAFIKSQQTKVPDESEVARLDRIYHINLLSELFGFQRTHTLLESLRRTVDEAFSTLFPNVCAEYARTSEEFRSNAVEVAGRFAAQFSRMVMDPTVDPAANDALKERIRAGAAYFITPLRNLLELLSLTPKEHDSAIVTTRLKDRMGALSELLYLQIGLLRHFRTADFSVSDYLRRKAEIFLEAEGMRKNGTTRKKTESTSAPSGISNPEVYKALAAWRKEKADEEGVAAYRIMPNKTLIAIAVELPDSPLSLKKIKGVGPFLFKHYGHEILEVIGGATRL